MEMYPPPPAASFSSRIPHLPKPRNKQAVLAKENGNLRPSPSACEFSGAVGDVLSISRAFFTLSSKLSFFFINNSFIVRGDSFLALLTAGFQRCTQLVLS